MTEETTSRAREHQFLQRPGVKNTRKKIKHHDLLVDEEGHIAGFLDFWIGRLVVGILARVLGRHYSSAVFAQRLLVVCVFDGGWRRAIFGRIGM